MTECDDFDAASLESISNKSVLNRVVEVEAEYQVGRFHSGNDDSLFGGEMPFECAEWSGFVGPAGEEDFVAEAFEDGGDGTPPSREREDEDVGFFDGFLVFFYERVEGFAFGPSVKVVGSHHRVEVICDEVNFRNVVACGFGLFANNLRDTLIEAAFVWVTFDYQIVHSKSWLGRRDSNP